MCMLSVSMPCHYAIECCNVERRYADSRDIVLFTGLLNSKHTNGLLQAYTLALVYLAKKLKK